MLTSVHGLHLEVPEMPVMVTGDDHRLGQVLDNLLGNAIKYSTHGGDITVTVRVDARRGEARLTVADQGAGIPADILPHLFERFYRGQHASSEAGLGLGLYISRMLIEAHGGRIWASSTPGVGSTFTIALPREHPPEQ
jgi:signal transduction histidine kinase